MKINHWKIITVVLASVLLGFSFSAYSTRASSSVTVTEVQIGQNFVDGEIVGFSCVSETDGELSEGTGGINGSTSCYVLTK